MQSLVARSRLVSSACVLSLLGLIHAAEGAAADEARTAGNALLETLEVADIGAHVGETTVTMRDGVRLSTSVVLPKNGEGKRLPTLLVRTPYAPTLEFQKNKSFLRLLLDNGYAIVIQNERGTQWSEGVFHFLPYPKQDGSDTLSWIAAQKWSNGNVATYGCSSSAENQLALASENHPAHKAMIARSAAAGIGSYGGGTSRGLFYKGGVPQIGPWSWWYGVYGHTNRPKLPESLSPVERSRLAATSPATIDDPFEKNPEARAYLPSAGILDALAIPQSDFNRFIQIGPTDEHWSSVGHLQEGDKPRVPALHVNGWYDVGAYETVKMFEVLQSTPNQYLIMAPTAHCSMEEATEQSMVGKRPVGDGRFDYDDLYLKWLNYWLKGEKNDVVDQPRVTVAVMGSSQWAKSDRWPLPELNNVTYRLASRNGANSLFGDGELTASKVGPREFDELVSNPNYPVPSRGGGCCDPDVAQDQTSVEARNDVLVYTTEEFRQGQAVVGEIGVKLYVSADVRDADLALKLVDLYPDGRAFNLYDTMLRLRYREGFNSPSMMKDGEVYEVNIEGLITSNFFAAGHRLRIEIAGSNFPNFERNLQTGGDNFNETQSITGRIRIHHSEKYPSGVVFPVCATCVKSTVESTKASM